MNKYQIKLLLRIFFFLVLFPTLTYADIYEWQAILMNEKSCETLRNYLQENEDAKKAWKEIYKQACTYAEDQPNPLEIIYYEGLLDTNKKRIRTVESLMDMRKLAYFYYADIITGEPVFKQRIKEYVLAWVNTYKPTGNPINENKLEAIYLTYHKNRGLFSEMEQEEVDAWIRGVADAELSRDDIPMTNWQTKRIKLILYSGIILDDDRYKEYVVKSYRDYVAYSLKPDGRSLDLEERDALAYHVSGLKPLILVGMILDQFNELFPRSFHPFAGESANGSSVKKSVDFVIPFALGDKQHAEWVNSTAKIDQARAEAGLKEYQKGILFKPSKSLSLFEQAMYFDQKYKKIMNEILKENDTSEYYKSWTFFIIDGISG